MQAEEITLDGTGSAVNVDLLSLDQEVPDV
jgi:hypothetical protein